MEKTGNIRFRSGLLLAGIAVSIAAGSLVDDKSRWSSIHYYKAIKRRIAAFNDSVNLQDGTLIGRPYGMTIVQRSSQPNNFEVIVDPEQEQSGGVFLDTYLSSAQTSRSRLVFDVEGSDVMLRTGVGENFRYQSADAQNFVLLESAVPLEVYVYLPAAGRFYIKNLRLEACPEPLSAECKNDVDLIDEVKHSPGFPANGDTFALAKFLLNWGANAADYDAGKSLQKVSGIVYPRLSAGEIYYQYYAPSKLAGYCGSLGIFQSKLFRAFGLDAFTVNFGVAESNLTHVSVVVRDGATKKFYLMDPTFNGYFTRAGSGEQLDVAEVLTLPREQIVFRDRDLAARDFLMTRAEASEALTNTSLRNCESADTVVVCKRDDFRLKDFWDGHILDAANKAGISATDYGFIELMKRGFFGVGEGLTEDSRKDFIAMLGDHGIVVKPNLP